VKTYLTPKELQEVMRPEKYVGKSEEIVDTVVSKTRAASRHA
jgi:adenylosuccinate lyase